MVCSTFFITWCLLLPRRCVDSLKGSRSDRGNVFLLLYTVFNFRITLKSMFFYHMISNAAAKVSGITWEAPEVIAATIDNLLNKNNTKQLKFSICLLYHAVNSRITLKSVFFDHKMSNAAAKLSGLTWGAPEAIAAIIHNLLTKDHTKTLKFNICLLYPAVNSRIALKSMFSQHMMFNAAAKVSGLT